MSLEYTIDIIHKLQTDVEKLYFLFDDSRTSQITINDVNERMRLQYPNLEYEVYKAPKLIDLKDYVVDKNDEDAAFVYSFFMIDQQNIAYDPNYSAKIVANASTLPVYGLWDFSLDTKVVGGRMISGYQQGAKMGELLIQYLKDELNVAISDSNIDNLYIFDFTALKHHELSTWALPKSTQFINKPITFYERHKNVLLGSFALAVLLIIYIIILQAQVKSKTRQIEKTTHHLMEYKRQASRCCP